MTKSDDTEKPSRSPKAGSPLKRKRVAGLAKFAKAAGSDDMQGERIAKAMARAGLCSRREAEAWILDGRVSLNGKVLDSPAVTVSAKDRVLVDGEPLPVKERTRLFLYHKPRGLVTTTHDPEGRPTVFDRLSPELPRVVTVGRLDINTEGLLLLTNDGGLARVLELPSTGWLRRYRVRAFGEVTKEQLDALKDGVTIEGISYGPVEAEIDTVTGSNVWLTVGFREGKNREVKRILQHLGLTVNRLIRVSFGPFQLGDLDDGDVREIRGKVLRDQLGQRLVEEAGADFDAPIIHHVQGGEGEPDRASKAAKPSAEVRSSGDTPRKRVTRTHMEFLGTGEDGSRQARLDREGKPSVAVKYIAKSRGDSAPRGRGSDARNTRGPKSDAVADRKSGGRSFDDKPKSGAHPADGGRARRGVWSEDPRGQRRGSDRPEQGDRPLRSEGFRDRPSGAVKRGNASEAGDRPYRSAASKDRPTGGIASRPKRDGHADQDRAGGRADKPEGRRAQRDAGPTAAGERPPRNGGKEGDARGSRTGGFGTRGPRTGTTKPGGPKAAGPKAGGPKTGGPKTGGSKTGGSGADRRR